MDAETDKKQGEDGKSQEARKPDAKRSKTAALRIHEEQIIAPQGLPPDAREQGWRFKGYDDYVVQDLKIEACTTRYRLEIWMSPQGQNLKGKLPVSVQGHYGVQLRSYVLYQYHHQRVTQPLLLAQLHDLDIAISESDIREYVSRRKTSGSTRSEDGRRCRDTFTSLKKTCRKLGVSFWQYRQGGKRECDSPFGRGGSHRRCQGLMRSYLFLMEWKFNNSRNFAGTKDWR